MIYLDDLISGQFTRKPCIFVLDDIINAVGGVAQAGVNYAATEATNKNNLQIARETNAANKALYEQQYADQVAMWEMNNQYNSPSAQMDRLRKAGLNPALNMGSNPTGQAQTPSVPSAAPMQGATMQAPMFNFSDAFQAFSSALKNRAETQGQMIDNQWKDAQHHQELLESLSRTNKNIEETKNNPVQRSYWRALRDYQLQELAFNSQLFDARKQSADLQNRLTEANIDLVQEQSMNFHIDSAIKNINLQMAKFDLHVAPVRLQAALNELYSRAQMQRSAAGLADRQSVSEIFRANGIRLSNQQLEECMPYIQRMTKAGAESGERTVKQQILDYSNPFRYIGGAGAALGGSAAAAMKYLF